MAKSITLSRFKKKQPDFFIKKIKPSEIGLSRATLFQWSEAGIIPKSSEDGKWARLDFFETFWLQTVVALRSLNIPIEAILQIRENNMKEDVVMDIVWRLMTEDCDEAVLDIQPKLNRNMGHYTRIDLQTIFEQTDELWPE